MRWLLLPLLLLPLVRTASASTIDASTNQWTLAPSDTVESVLFVVARSVAAEGTTLDDSFWIAQDDITLSGDFGNDVWALAQRARLDGTFRDHARVLAPTILVEGVVSNGLWAAGGSIAVATNAHLYGDQLLYADQLSLLGHIEGDVYAKARTITLGGTIVGNLRLVGDDIVIRPGTTVVGDLHYITTNQSIVLDPNSHVSGSLTHLPSPAARDSDPVAGLLLQLYFFTAAILVGAALMIAGPDLTGRSVRSLRVSLWKCGLVGIALLFFGPLVLAAVAFTVIGLPLAAALAAVYGLVIYLGKCITALAIGSALLHQRGQISLAGALLSLVAGLFLYYSMAFVPLVGSSLQMTATAFGAGGLVLAAWSARGRIRAAEDVNKEPES